MVPSCFVPEAPRLVSFLRKISALGSCMLSTLQVPNITQVLTAQFISHHLENNVHRPVAILKFLVSVYSSL